MESLSLYLQDYKELVGGVASIVTISQFLAGCFICKDIYKKGSTDGISANPFIGGVVIGVLMLKYAALLQDDAMLIVNFAALGLNVFYILFYIYYSDSKSKAEIKKSSTIGVAMIAVLYGYASVENPDLLEYRYGLICTVLMLVLIGSPLLEIGQVIKNEDASGIPFPIVFCGTIVSLLWLLYGIILMNNFMIFQNVVGLALCLIQVTLSIMYPGKAKTD